MIAGRYPGSELVFFRAGPGSILIRPSLSGLPHTVLSERRSLLAPLWAMLMNWAHGTSKNQDYTAEGSLDFSALLRGLRFLISYRPDLVVAHDQYAGFVALAYKRIARAPYLLYVHESLLGDPTRLLSHLSKRGATRLKRLSRVIDSRVLGNASAVACNSDGTLRSVRASGLVKARTLETLFPGVPPVDLVGLHDRPWALAVSTWDTARHPELYLEVSRLLTQGPLVLAGSWRYNNEKERAAFERVAAREVSSGNLVITGQVTQDELTGYYRRSRVFLRFGVEEEGPGMGAIRALSHGLPIVTNRPLGISDVVGRYKCGVVLPNPDPAKAATAIEQILRNPEGWNQMHASALQAASENSWTSHNGRLVGLIDSLVLTRDGRLRLQQREPG